MNEFEEKVSDKTTIKIEFFSLKTNSPDKFIEKLEQLCKEYSHRANFTFKFSFE